MKNPRVSRRKEILKIRAEINAKETKETIAKINKPQSWFFEKINQIDKPLARLIKKQRKKNQINNIRNENGEITTDMVANMADKIAVMYAGKIVEYGTANDVFYDPRHPYTWALLSSMPDLDTKEKLDAIPGTSPNMIFPPKGDAFAERNKYAMQIDFEEQPPMFKISDTHYAATWLVHPNAPKVEPPKIVTDRIARMMKLNEESRGDSNE